jgi:hypothetical protein
MVHNFAGAFPAALLASTPRPLRPRTPTLLWLLCFAKINIKHIIAIVVCRKFMRIHAGIACPLGDAFPSSIFTSSPLGQELPSTLRTCISVCVAVAVTARYLAATDSSLPSLLLTLDGVVVCRLISSISAIHYGHVHAQQSQAAARSQQNMRGLRPPQVELLFTLYNYCI